jgi:hypothetical protein
MEGEVVNNSSEGEGRRHRQPRSVPSCCSFVACLGTHPAPKGAADPLPPGLEGEGEPYA